MARERRLGRSHPLNPNALTMSSKIAAAPRPIERAMAAYRSGALSEAERLCGEILATDPSSFAALHLLGVVQWTSGAKEKALASYELAILASPGDATVYSNRGIVLGELKRHGKALESFDRALALDPRLASAHNNRGSLLTELGLHTEAFDCFARAIALQPNYAQAFRNQGTALYHLGRLEEALAGYDRAIELEPGFFDAYLDRGRVLRALGRLEPALADYDVALALRSDFAAIHDDRSHVLFLLNRLEDALESSERAIAARPDMAAWHANRGHVLRAMKRFAEALASYDRAIALDPINSVAHGDRGHVLFSLKRFEEALASCDRAIALKPDFAKAHSNRGLVLRALKRLDEAVASFDRAIVLEPGLANAHANRGDALHELARPEEAIRSYETAIAIEPEHVGANGCLGHSLLLLGEFDLGWKQYEWRKKLPEPLGNPSHSQPAWSGREPLAGATLFLHSEQGLGDTIQFCRYAKLARALGAEVILSVQKPLVRLLRSLDPEVEIIGEGVVPVAFDYHCALMSSPFAFGTLGDSIPAAIPYLRAEPSRVEQWRRRLGDGKLKIGVCWRGSATGTDIGRSFPPALLDEISNLPDVSLISLQKGDGVDRARSISPAIVDFGDELDAGNEAFLDTAAIMRHLDLIITADTSIAHLSGALGRPTWVALKHVPDWRWGPRGERTPWYPTMRLFRQKSRDDWVGVFAEIESEARSLIVGATRAVSG
jgi:tetratricopeptide (TPR) repeat protein